MQVCFHIGATNWRLAMSNWQQPEKAEALPLGAHLVTPRRGYLHHGIYVGDDRVVHYAGWSRKMLRGPLQETSLAEFADGRAVTVKASARAAYAAEEVVARARSRLGKNRYRLTTNNCEHFSE